jgi:RimJ/RimL family protein N-acetyltransferase
MDSFFAPERHDAGDFVLRSLDVGDGSLLMDAVAESYEHLRPWMPWAKAQPSLEESEGYARRSRARYLLAEDFAIGVFSPDGTRLLGGSGFHLREGPITSGCAEIGMWVRASEAHRGLGSGILAAMLHWGFSAWPWVRLAWRCDQNNVASVRVAERCGLRLEGVLRGQQAMVGPGRRDTACYALTKDEWLAREGEP